MKTKNGYCITHDYSGSSSPSIVSTHRTLSGAESRLARSRASFRSGYPNTGSVRAIFPYSIRPLIDGEAAAAEGKCQCCGKTEQDCIASGMEFNTSCLSNYNGQTLCPDCIPAH